MRKINTIHSLTLAFVTAGACALAVQADTLGAQPERGDMQEKREAACAHASAQAKTAYARATRPIMNRNPQNDLTLAMVELEIFQSLGCSPDLLTDIHE